MAILGVVLVHHLRIRDEPLLILLKQFLVLLIILVFLTYHHMLAFIETLVTGMLACILVKARLVMIFLLTRRKTLEAQILFV